MKLKRLLQKCLLPFKNDIICRTLSLGASGSVAGKNVYTWTGTSVEVEGYTPVGISAFNLTGTYAYRFKPHIMQLVGSTVTLSVRNMADTSSASATATVEIMYCKNDCLF